MKCLLTSPHSLIIKALYAIMDRSPSSRDLWWKTVFWIQTILQQSMMLEICDCFICIDWSSNPVEFFSCDSVHFQGLILTFLQKFGFKIEFPYLKKYTNFSLINSGTKRSIPTSKIKIGPVEVSQNLTSNLYAKWSISSPCVAPFKQKYWHF